MSLPPLLIYGAGGHAKVAYTVAIAQNRQVLGFIDPYTNLDSLYDLPIIQTNLTRPDAELFIAIGHNPTRKKVAELNPGEFATLIHPSAVVAPDAIIGPGTLICAGAVIQAAAVIGSHCIVNTRASVDHDCHIGDFAHIAPGSTLCGGVSIGAETLIGAGSTIIQNMKVGHKSTLAAGAVAIEEIPSNETWAGIPAVYKP
jgi:acetyltransferase EpsM